MMCMLVYRLRTTPLQKKEKRGKKNAFTHHRCEINFCLPSHPPHLFFVIFFCFSFSFSFSTLLQPEAPKKEEEEEEPPLEEKAASDAGSGDFENGREEQGEGEEGQEEGEKRDEDAEQPPAEM